MSTLEISLRLTGDLPPPEELIRILNVKPTKLLRRGQHVSQRRIQPTDVWCLDLAAFDGNSHPIEMQADLQKSARRLEELAEAITSITQKAQCKAELYISTIREEDQGGFSLPPDLVAAAAAAGLSIELSILVMLEENEPKLMSAPGKAAQESM
ncbi:DUF4279 domain-containing protein [Leptothermofonsia sichuanensis E412]|uniref:DUF4279 domain-containing protein n=1 Tax=Leptothermofonsia sichuanensis TaxID=2917832 RepID=UPI001CA6AFA7|nr:DUF4279 domain-containing protein [Leptothermofonsia sichuanensis]QZZ18565.1 DUF4279 domain-containing protein [Leptothermofonsia sichuanensis E412]